MKILVFSDTHLTPHFNKNKYLFLRKIIQDSDRVIINGDFWDSYLTDFDSFVQSPWKKLFPLLKKRKAVYIFGNHDAVTSVNIKARLFSDFQVESYTIRPNSKKILLLHGHIFDGKYEILKLIVNVYHSLTGKYDIVSLFVFLQKLTIQIFGVRFYQNLFAKRNRKIKKILNKLKTNSFVITGHTHKSEVDIPAKYANSGLIRFGIGQYITITNGKITLINKRY